MAIPPAPDMSASVRRLKFGYVMSRRWVLDPTRARVEGGDSGVVGVKVGDD
jgi:hypothetical protein